MIPTGRRPISLVALCVSGIFGLLTACSNDGGTGPDTEPPHVTITNPATGATLAGVVAISVTATDNRKVTRLDLLIDGQVAISTVNPPYNYTWDTGSETDGPHTIQANAYDAANNVGNSAVSVTVGNPFNLVFFNTTFTDIAMNVQSTPPFTIPTNGNVTVTFQGKPASVTYNASTSGKTTQGTQVGRLVTWNYTFAPAHAHADTVFLVVSPSLFFIKLRNSGFSTLTPFYVNFGLIDQTRDNIVIPADGVTYNTGYYLAYANTEVRAYLAQDQTSYVYWDQGQQFTLPFVDNQFAVLVNTCCSVSAAPEGERPEPSTFAPQSLLPSGGAPSRTIGPHETRHEGWAKP